MVADNKQIKIYQTEDGQTQIQKAAKSSSMKTDMGRGLIDILSHYTQTFLVKGRISG